ILIMVKKLDAGNSTSYLKEIEDNAKLTEKHVQITRQQTAVTDELIAEQRRIESLAEVVNNLVRVSLGVGIGVVLMGIAQLSKKADEEMEEIKKERIDKE